MARTFRPPQPAGVAPLRPQDWSKYRRNWLDDGTDCLSSSFEESLRLQHGEDAPDLPEMEAAYRRWHPDWDDTPGTMVLEWYWEALAAIDVDVAALHQRGEIVAQIVGAIDAGYFPTAWVYLYDPFTGAWFHHAIVAVAHYDDWIVFWDPQRGIGWEYRKDLFGQTGLDGATSGYAYVAVWTAPAKEEPMPIRRVVGVVTADTGKDISGLINAAAEEHGFDPVGFLAGLIGESNLHEHARREKAWPDVSFGLSQPTVKWFRGDVGFVDREPDGTLSNTPHNRAAVRAWCWEAENLIPYTATLYAGLIRRFQTGGDALRTWTRWNAPARTLEENAVAQPHAVANYRKGLVVAETYRAPEESDMAKPQPPASIVWKGSPNFEKERGGVKPVAIVNHVAEGSLPGVDSWFGQTASQVSAHFCVGAGGEIHQYVRSSDTAWANGRLNQPNTAIPWIADAVNRGINPNKLTISIEREGFTGEPLTEPQYQSILALHRYLCGYWDIPADAQHIVGHRDIDSVNRANCPGPHFPWTRLLDDLNFTEPEPPVITSTAALDEIFRVAGAIANKHPDVLPEVITIHRMVDVLKGE